MSHLLSPCSVALFITMSHLLSPCSVALFITMSHLLSPCSVALFITMSHLLSPCSVALCITLSHNIVETMTMSQIFGLAQSLLETDWVHFPTLTLKAQIMTAPDDIHKYFFIVFQRK